MKAVPLTTILKPEEGPYQHLIYAGPGRGLVRGTGSTTLLCGKCSVVLAQDIGDGQMNETALKCTACGAFNALTPAPEQ